MIQNGAGSKPIGIRIIKAMLPMGKDLFMRKEIALTRVCLVKYFLPEPLEIQYIYVLEKSMCFMTLDLKEKLINPESTV